MFRASIEDLYYPLVAYAETEEEARRRLKRAFTKLHKEGQLLTTWPEWEDSVYVQEFSAGDVFFGDSKVVI